MDLTTAIAYSLHENFDHGNRPTGLDKCPEREAHYERARLIATDPAVLDAVEEYPTAILVKALEVLKDLANGSDGPDPYSNAEITAMCLTVLNEAYDMGVLLPGEA
jgi:hypothetical protein